MPDSSCALSQLDPLLLAWAAGFFDGEGSTFVSERANRPGYLRLDVSVPQSDHTGIPEVLLRFQKAVLGMGSIGRPNGDDVYLWRPNGFMEAQATLALLWGHLGAVKRAQAAAVMGSVQHQYATGRCRPRGPRPARRRHDGEHMGTGVLRPSARELGLAWAAGFLDAEGCFGVYRSMARKNGPVWKRIRLSASQHGEAGSPPDVLLRVQRTLGTGRIERHGEPDDFKWLVEGDERVSEALDLVMPSLGRVKREQAQVALAQFRTQVRLKGNAAHCRRGHEYTRLATMKAGRVRKICNACDRLLERAKRAALGIPPRQFRNVARRYNF